MQQKLLQIFLPQEAGASGNNIEKEPRNYAKNWKLCVLYIYREYLFCRQFNARGSFLQKCINFVEHSDFLTLKVV